MGAGDTDPFGNDTACDWKYDAERCADLLFIAKTIEEIHECGDPIS